MSLKSLLTPVVIQHQEFSRRSFKSREVFEVTLPSMKPAASTAYRCLIVLTSVEFSNQANVPNSFVIKPFLYWFTLWQLATPSPEGTFFP